MAALSASTWGDPTATKHVFLIHGITGSSQIWYRIAQEFASRGYFVTAPDLLGHGTARRGSDYTIAAIAEELRPFFTTAGGNDHPYDIVIGHSLGGIVATALFPLLKSIRPVRVVLVDPPFELTPESVTSHKEHFGNVIRNPKTPEDYLVECPLWRREDVIFFSLGTRLCDVAAVEAILDQNVPWSFSRQLFRAPDNVEITVLAADPSKLSYVTEEDMKPYSFVTAKTVWGASHLIPLEAPLAVVEAALEGTESRG